MKRKLISAILAMAGVAGSGVASAAIVGGVDFGPFGTHLDTTTLAETLITGNGQTLLGYGVVNTVNGNAAYTGDTSRLFFTFSYTSQNFSATSVEFVNGDLKIYKGTLGNLLLQNSPTNLINIAGLTPWVELKGHGNLGGAATATAEILATGTLSGAALSFGGTGLLDVDTASAFGLASVKAYLDSNGLLDALLNPVDIRFNTSGDNSVLNPNDANIAQCRAGTAAAGNWCIAGSADLRGDLAAVPEPASLALVGLSLVGLAATRRRKPKAA